MYFVHDSHTEENNREYLVRVIGRNTPCQNQNDADVVLTNLNNYVDEKLYPSDTLGGAVLRYIIENDLLEGLKTYMDLQCWYWNNGGVCDTLTIAGLQAQLRNLNVQIDQSKSPQIAHFIQQKINEENEQKYGEYDESYYESGNESDYDF